MSAASSAATTAELMLARKRAAAMAAEDSQSFVAQRYFYRSAQLPLPSPFFERNYTWQHAYEQRHNTWLGALQVLQNARDLLQRGMHAQALASLRDELSSEGEEAEEEELETDAEVDIAVEETAPVQVPDAMLAMQLQQEMERSALRLSPGTALSPAWFTGTVHRLG